MGEVRLLTGMAVLHYDNLCIDPNQRRVYVNGRVIKRENGDLVRIQSDLPVIIKMEF